VHTSAPVQNMGHLLQGSSRAFCNHVLRYGLLTTSGRTGGWRVEARDTPDRRVATVATTARRRMVIAPRYGRVCTEIKAEDAARRRKRSRGGVGGYLLAATTPVPGTVDEEEARGSAGDLAGLWRNQSRTAAAVWID